MELSKRYENFPLWIIIVSNMQSLLVYALGFLILLNIAWFVAGCYLLFILFLEYRIVSKHCVDCYYFGKACGFGKGRISALFFKQGPAAHFCSQKFTWKDLIPDMLVSLIPLIAGIILLILHFDIILLISILLIVVLITAGNSFVRGDLTCKFCRQKDIGCPAEQLFSKKTTTI